MRHVGCGGPLCTVLHGPHDLLGRARPGVTNLAEAITLDSL